ncbi:hypothetical protein QJQ45_018724 [Haematococcus lacustris]|nr:hypothetical protein QJQ45_018724 [Haematococcus lacustris]
MQLLPCCCCGAPTAAMTALQARGQGVAGAGQQAGGVRGPGLAAPSDQGPHRLRGSSTGLPPLAPGGRAPALEGHMDPVRVTQAACALAANAGPGASQEALQLRAALLFNRSVEVKTGFMQWTRGELLGEGSFGRVYAGLNQLTGGLMAVKVLQLLSRRSGPADAVAQQLAELTKELELYKQLAHKHVVGYLDHHYEPRSSTLYIFLEYVPGGSISSMLERFGRFSEELVRNYTRQLLLGLEYLHACKVVHRDLKGGNALVTRDGVVKLADFGASKAFQVGEWLGGST